MSDDPWEDAISHEIILRLNGKEMIVSVDGVEKARQTINEATVIYFYVDTPLGRRNLLEMAWPPL